ncbi:hypothetical protein Tco_1383356 [Tanacetum coccineum]
MKLEEMKQYLFNILGKKINALYYKGVRPNRKLRADEFEAKAEWWVCSRNFFDGRCKFYIDHVGVNFIMAKYIYPNATLAEMMNHVITDYKSDSEEERREVAQNDYTFDQMVEWAEQEHFEDEETKQVQRHKEL